MSRALHATDLIVLGMIVFGALAISRTLGLTHPVAAWAAAMAWTCPAARRMIAWRRQTRPQRQLPLDDPASTIPFLVFGYVPWAILPAIDRFGSSHLLTQLNFPDWVRWAGVALILCGVLRPLWLRRTLNPGTGSGSEIEALGLLLVTASPLLAGLTCCGVALRLSSGLR